MMKKYFLMLGILIFSLTGYAGTPPGPAQTPKKNLPPISMVSNLTNDIIKKWVDTRIFINNCDAAYQAYNSAHNAYAAKQRVCSEMDRARDEMDENNDLGVDLNGLASDAPNNACGDYLIAQAHESFDRSSEASDRFWAKWDECHFNGAGLDALKIVVDETERNTCQACNNRWPGLEIAPELPHCIY